MEFNKYVINGWFDAKLKNIVAIQCKIKGINKWL